MSKNTIINLAIILIFFGTALCFYQVMPETMASHWDARGQVNGYMPKFWSLFLIPLIALVIFFLFLVVPKIDPLKNDVKNFRKHLGNFSVVILIFFFYLFLLTILWNLGYKFNLSQFLAPSFTLLFFYCGIFIERIKRNWFAGIRTPWTLSSDRVWDKTHKLGGKLFKAAGLIALIGFVFPDQAIFLVIVPAVLAAAFLFVYSYVEYRKEIGNQND